MTELFANSATSTLNGAINNAVTSLTVTSAALFPTSGNFRILIDSEIMLVTAVAGAVFTVERGAEGTTAASHLNLAPVTCIVTAGALNAFVNNGIFATISGSTFTGPVVGASNGGFSGSLTRLVGGTPFITVPAGNSIGISTGSLGQIILSGSATAPGGSTTEVQYNNAGVFAGDANFTFNNGTGVLTALGFTATPYADIGVGGVTTFNCPVTASLGLSASYIACSGDNGKGTGYNLRLGGGVAGSMISWVPDGVTDRALISSDGASKWTFGVSGTGYGELKAYTMLVDGWTDITLANAGTTGLIVATNGTQVGATQDFGGGTGVVGIDNASVVPTTNPTGGGILYADAGAGKWRGSGGTVTTFGPADPHCPKCGRDFALEHQNETLGEHLALCLPCLVDALKAAGINTSDFTIHDKRGTTKAQWDANHARARDKAMKHRKS
jgi:hypothetical protein